MEEILRVISFDKLPSPADFESQIESRNVPAVFHGCIKDWKAISKWNPSNAGLDYLQVPLPFSTFINLCKQHVSNSDDNSGVCVEPENQELPGSTADEACLPSPRQVYLAQVPILNLENRQRSQLETLREDIELPTLLERKALTSINLWMNNATSRSSTHYDPHHNLLCIVAGCKQVVLWPPSACPLLYPMPIHGEASNHSSVDLENPDYSIHSRALNLIELSQKVTLHTGDALFIPEGWFHQVDSDDLTIAVNYWWQSSINRSMLEHMDAYYLRIILRRLLNREMDHILGGVGVENRKSGENEHTQRSAEKSGNDECELDQNCGTTDLKEIDQNQKMMLHQLEPFTLQELHKLVSLVHENMNGDAQNQPVQSCIVDCPALHSRGEYEKLATVQSFCLEDDPVASILWNMGPLQLQQLLLVMVHNFPRTLEALILHMLSPVGAEVLTRKFDEMDQLFRKENRNQFYQSFYGVFDDQFSAMEVILNKKESFALQVFHNVLDKYVGVKLMNLAVS